MQVSERARASRLPRDTASIGYTMSCLIHFETKSWRGPKRLPRTRWPFRVQVETDIKKIWDRHLQGLVNPEATQQEKADWDHIAKRISDSSYTAFVSSSDLGANEEYLHEGWFEEALDRIKVYRRGWGCERAL